MIKKKIKVKFFLIFFKVWLDYTINKILMFHFDKVLSQKNYEPHF